MARALRQLRPSTRVVTGVAVAAVLSNTVIVVTGALVRLTGSGLGCPTWPRCTSRSYVITPEAGVHGWIEFSNRLLTFALGAVAVLAIIVVMAQQPRRRDVVALAWGLLAGIVAQALIGGVTVLTHLNPYTVAGHFLVSIAAIAVAVALHVRAREGDAPARWLVRPELRWLSRLIVAVAALVLALGTIVTGSGPHAGDQRASRTGFDPAVVTQLHADAVMLLVGLTLATVVALRAAGVPAGVRRAAAALVAAELGQAAIGYAQHFTHLPVALVAVHVLGACLVWLAALYLAFSLRERVAPPPGRRPVAPIMHGSGRHAGETARSVHDHREITAETEGPR